MIVVNTHPIHYFSPLYRQATASDDLAIHVIYQDAHGVTETMDSQFGLKIAFDIPLLEGFSSEFLCNRSPRPGVNRGFFGLINPGILKALRLRAPSYVIVHGWSNVTMVLTVFLARVLGHRVIMRAEAPITIERQRKTASRLVRRLILGRLLLGSCFFVLALGRQNREFYRLMGVEPSRILDAPYAVDNRRFRKALNDTDIEAVRRQIRTSLGVAEEDVVALMCGKLIEKKRPLDLVEALSNVANDVHAVFVGEGELRQQIESRAVALGLSDRCHVVGFVNQEALPAWYSAADVFVLASDRFETWGLVLNEAMNVAKPVIVSDQVGSAPDLVINGVNGVQYRCGDSNELAKALGWFMEQDEASREALGTASLRIIDGFGYDGWIEALAGMGEDYDGTD